MALVEQALGVDLLERPPDRLDVGGVERAVGRVEVEPEADPLGQPVPLLEELGDRLAAAAVELLDAVLLDLHLVGEAELLLDRDLDRQAVAVPAPLALDAVAAHRLVARVDVLEHAGEDVVGAGRAVGGRRPFVEHPLLGALAAAQRLGEHVALAPALEHLELELRKRRLGVDGAEHRRHSRCGFCRHPGAPRAARAAGQLRTTPSTIQRRLAKRQALVARRTATSARSPAQTPTIPQWKCSAASASGT